MELNLRSATFTINLKTDGLEYSDSFPAIVTGNINKTVSRCEFINAVHPEDEMLRQEAIAKATHHCESEYHPRLIWEDRSIQRVHIQLKCRYDDAGRAESLHGTIALLGNIALPLQEHEGFKTLITRMPVAMTLLRGEDFIVELANPDMLLQWGKGANVIGKRLIDVLPELKGQPFIGLLTQVLDTGIEYRHNGMPGKLQRNGVLEDIYFNFVYAPLHENGVVTGVIVTATEVTELVIARKEALEAKALLEQALSMADLGTWEYILERGRVTFSDNIRLWFGFVEADVPTTEVFKPIREDHREGVIAALDRALANGSDGVYDVEYVVKAQDTGKERIIRAQGQTYFDEDGNAFKISGILQNITIQRRQQQALEEQVALRTEALRESNEQLTHSNEELSQYAYVTSHDLQEPLRKIQIFSDMLGKQPSLSEQNKPFVDKISHASARMSQLIQDLLSFSRLLKSEAMRRPVNLSQVMKDIANDFELVIEEKKSEIWISDLPVIEAVALQMNQLFYNLLGNALKFSSLDKTPRIEITSYTMAREDVAKYIQKPKEDRNYYCITMTDNGIGFEVKYADQIFEVFKRLHGREIYPGSGIGLALCRRIVTNHGGHIYATSTPGVGTTFYMILPNK